MSAGNHTARITEKTLKSLKPKDKPWIIRDDFQKGFQIKINPSGQASYFVEARLGGIGKVKKIKIGLVGGMPLTQAREKARETLTLIRSGNDPQITKRVSQMEGQTLGQLLESYLQFATAKKYKKRTIQDYQYYFKRHFSSWQKKRVKDITKHEILNWYQSGLGTPTETDNAFRHLNAVLNYAVGLEIIQINPCSLINKSKLRVRRKPKTTHLAVDDDLGAFLKAFIEFKYVKDSQKVARDLILLILTTGLRFNEVQKIEFAHVDLEKKLFIIPDPKNRQDHTIPLVPLTFTLLRYRKEQNQKEKSRYVFRIKGGNTKSPYVTDIRKTLHKICDSAQISYVSPHDLRRTFATALNDIGVRFSDVKALMNHKDKDVTSMYIQSSLSKHRKILTDLVKYYDHKIIVPSDGKYSKSATHALQSAIFENIEPEYEILNQPKGYDDYMERLDKDYWYGLDADQKTKT